jgi:SAM-dependent methyltransferase
MQVCGRCGFVFNKAFEPQKLTYGQDYENTQSCSESFSKHMSDLVERMLVQESVCNSTIVEVGCGKGHFLHLLVEDEALGNRGIGFDPSYLGPLEMLSGRLRFERRFINAGAKIEEVDVVVCRHVIEHVKEPILFLESLRDALPSGKDIRLYFETPCVEWILENQVIWDFFYEHCSLFSRSSLRAAFEKTGFQVDNVSHVFNGQYLWLSARTAKSATQGGSWDCMDVPAKASRYSAAESGLKLRWQGRIQDLLSEGSVAVWGAGAKGTTFASLVDPDRQYIDCLVDINPRKQGYFVPGSGHPIVSIDELQRRNIRSAIVMNPNYLAENEAMLSSSGLAINLIT